MDFALDGVAVGTGNGVVTTAQTTVTARVRVTALLDEQPKPEIAARRPDHKPYWDLERARVAGTRDVPVEFLVNGRVVATRRVLADGRPHDVEVELSMPRSGWVAARILPSSHTNPIWIEVKGRPLQPSRASATWALEAVERCWQRKSAAIRAPERDAATAAYDHARAVYRKLLAEGIED